MTPADYCWMAGCITAYCVWQLAKTACVVIYWTLDR